jgi:hypothetical protein
MSVMSPSVRRKLKATFRKVMIERIRCTAPRLADDAEVMPVFWHDKRRSMARGGDAVEGERTDGG